MTDDDTPPVVPEHEAGVEADPSANGQAPPPEPPDERTVAPVAPTLASGTTEAQMAPLDVTWASEVTPRQVRWLWRGRIPVGEVTLVVGRGGLGKTVAVGADLAAAVTRGDLDGDLDGPGRVLVASAEDSREHTLVPRLMAADADLDCVGYLDDLAIPGDVDRLAAAIRQHSARAVVIDPLNAYLGFDIDSHKDKDLRVALGPVAATAHATGCAVVAIGHVNKLRSGDAYALVSGSIAYYNGPRSVLVIAPDPEADEGDQDARVLVHGKSNLSKPAAPMRFRMATRWVETADGPSESPAVEWGDEAADLSHADALAGLDADERSAVEDAAEWLRDRLGKGAEPAKTVKAEARRAGHAPRTLQRAAKRLGVQSRRQGFGEPATWELPSDASRAPSAPHTHSGATGATGVACVVCGRPGPYRHDRGYPLHSTCPDPDTDQGMPL